MKAQGCPKEVLLGESRLSKSGVGPVVLSGPDRTSREPGSTALGKPLFEILPSFDLILPRRSVPRDHAGAAAKEAIPGHRQACEAAKEGWMRGRVGEAFPMCWRAVSKGCVSKVVELPPKTKQLSGAEISVSKGIAF